MRHTDDPGTFENRLHSEATQQIDADMQPSTRLLDYAGAGSAIIMSRLSLHGVFLPCALGAFDQFKHYCRVRHRDRFRIRVPCCSAVERNATTYRRSILVGGRNVRQHVGLPECPRTWRRRQCGFLQCDHKEAIEFLLGSAGEIGFNRYTLLNLHALLSDNLLEDPTASGCLRTIAVDIGQTTFLPLEGVQRIEECFDQVLDTAAAICDPFEQAFFAMVHLPYLQPFEDVNKRVSRLAANIPLIQQNLCPLSFVDVSQSTYISAMLGIYELNRIELLRDVFVWAYKRSCARYSAVRQSLGEPDPFRFQYRQHITQAVADVVRRKMSKLQAVSYIQRLARELIKTSDRKRFIEVVKTQLLSLHEGSIARYRLRPSEFQAWREVWK